MIRWVTECMECVGISIGIRQVKQKTIFMAQNQKIDEKGE